MFAGPHYDKGADLLSLFATGTTDYRRFEHTLVPQQHFFNLTGINIASP